jgi:hypothetical protein
MGGRKSLHRPRGPRQQQHTRPRYGSMPRRHIEGLGEPSVSARRPKTRRSQDLADVEYIFEDFRGVIDLAFTTSSDRDTLPAPRA